MHKFSAFSNTRILAFLLIAFLWLSLQVSLQARFDHDEFEHIHAAWYVTQGDLPYKDFYENHHPLFWYVLAPAIHILGENTSTIMAMRVMMWVMLLAMALMIFLITRENTRSSEAGLLASILLLSSFLLVKKALEIRPDTPQVLCGLVSVYFVFLHFRLRHIRLMFLAGLAAGLSFVFLQKAVILFAAYAAMFAVMYVRRKIALKDLAAFLGGVLLPLGAFAIWLWQKGLWADYMITNWMLHLNKESEFEFLKHMKRSFGYNGLWWMAALAFVVMALSDKRMDVRLRWTAFLAAFFFLSVFAMPHQYAQYFLFSMALFSVGAAVALKAAMERARWSEGVKAAAIILLSIMHVVVIYERLLSAEQFSRQARQLDRISFVLAQTNRHDVVFDGNSDFNVFRRDVHYFWHSIGEQKGLDIYNKLTDGRFQDFDPCQLIRVKEPKFISDYHLDLEACGLEGAYQSTEFNKVFIRKK